MTTVTRSAMTSWKIATESWKTELQAGNVSKGTIDLRLSHLRRLAHVCPSPFAVTRPALIAFLAAERWAPEYRRSIRSSITGFYGWAHREGLIDDNPAARLPKVRVPIGEARPAPDEAIRTTLARADNRQTFMLLLGAVGGLRRKEIASVHSRDLDGDELRVRGKGGRERVISLPPALSRRLRAQGTGWLFPNGFGGHLTSAHVGVLLRRILPPGITPHMLRHAAASALHDEGLTMFELRRFLGHASVATTQRYVYVRDQRVAAATRAAAARFVA